MNAVERTAAKKLLEAWDRAVRAWHWCWAERDRTGYDSPDALSAEDLMHSTGQDFARLAGWQCSAPTSTACGY